MQEHFKSLNGKQLSYSFLTLSIESKDYTILASASEDGLGSVLLEGDNVVAYVFLTTQIYAKNHSPLDPKVAVMAFALRIWKHYLYRILYEIYSAHPLELGLFSEVWHITSLKKKLNLKPHSWLESSKDYKL